jgi:hypothetical protein
MFNPGALTSGFNALKVEGPREEKPAITSFLSVAPLAKDPDGEAPGNISEDRAPVSQRLGPVDP